MNREYHKWYSPSLKRDMELLVFGHAGSCVLFFPARKGRFYDYENWQIMDALQNKIEQGQLQVICLDSVDSESFYNDSQEQAEKVARFLQFEQYILTEVVPLANQKNRGTSLICAGCSLGAYYAVNFTLKYPQIFGKAIGMSGRYDLTQQLNHYRNLLPGYWHQNVYFNMPNQYVPGITDPKQLQALRKLEIILVVGVTDPCFGSNQYLSQALHNKGIPHQLFTWQEEAHRPCYWREMVKLYL